MSEEKCIQMIREGLILSAGDVAKKYNVTRQGVTLACRKGRLNVNEAVITGAGWFVARSAAEKLWTRRDEVNETAKTHS